MQPETESLAFARLPGRDLAGIARWRADSGLGNLLFPWARSVVAAERYGLRLIWPTWPQIAVPQLLRCEPPRFYAHLFVADRQRYVGGLQKLRVLRSVQRLPEQKLIEYGGCGAQPAVYEFVGISGYFSTMLGHFGMVKARLTEIASPLHPGNAGAEGLRVAVHVRRGDFSVAESPQELRSPTKNINLRLPIEWYVHVVRLLREILAEPVPVEVYSDGKDDELAPLLEVSNSRRCGGQSPLGDLLSLSGATVLVASGSTFSMWASYLGRMPVIWYPGRIRQSLYYDHPWAEVEVAHGERLPEEFVAKLLEMCS